MATLTIRNLDDDVKRRLRQRAATRGVSMEEEARRALGNWADPAPVRDEGLGTRLRRRFEAFGGIELEIPARGRSETTISVGKRWEGFIEGVLESGRYGSASEVVREGLRLVEEREARLKGLRDEIQAALDDPRRYTWDEIDAAIEADLDELERRAPDAAE